MKSNLLVLNTDKFITGASDHKTDLASANICQSLLSRFKEIYKNDQSDLILVNTSQDEIEILEIDKSCHYLSSQFSVLNRLNRKYQTVVLFNVFKNCNTIKCFNALRFLLDSADEIFVFNQKLENPSNSISLHWYSSKNLRQMFKLFGYDLVEENKTSLSVNNNSISHDPKTFINEDQKNEQLIKLYLEWSDCHQEPSNLSINPLSLNSMDRQQKSYECIYAKRTFLSLNTIFAAYINDKTATDYELLFRHCFGHEPTPGLWDFKFNNKSGYSLGLFEQTEFGKTSKLIAHYGAVKRKINYFGEPKLALQIGDVMVDAMGIKSLTRKGPFFSLVSIFLEQHIGYGREALLGFGFPNQKHMKIATLLGLYSEVESINEISWASQRLKLPFWYKSIKIDKYNFPKYAIFLQILWKKMSLDLKYSILGVRDASYIEQRYFKRPGKIYQLYLVKNRFSNVPKGLLIFNHNVDRFELIDIVAPINNIPFLINVAREFATSHESKKLLLRITSNFVNIFKTDDSNTNTLDISIPANIYTQGPSIDILKNKWWLMSGDMDYV